MTEPQTDVKTYEYFANNRWRKAQNEKTFEVHEPYSGKLFARVAAGSREDARGAVDAAATGAVITTVDQIISELAVDWTSPNGQKLRGILDYQ